MKSQWIVTVALALWLCSCAPQVQHPSAEALAPKTGPEDIAAIAQWNTDYAALLSACVRRAGRVDYSAAVEQHKAIARLVKQLAEPRTFESDAQTLACWLNAYNLLVIAQVVERWPIDSPRDISGFFDVRPREVFGETMTLDELRGRLMRTFGDARIHVALVDAAMGSPAISATPYTDPRVNEQLDAAARQYVNDGIHVSRIGPTLLVSPMFKDDEADFAAPPYGSVRGFLRTYAKEGSPLAQILAAGEAATVEYQLYNWALNRSD